MIVDLSLWNVSPGDGNVFELLLVALDVVVAQPART